MLVTVAYQDKAMCDALQVVTSLRVGELADADAVGGVELLDEELAAGLLHLVQLQQAGRRQHRLYRVLAQSHASYTNIHKVFDVISNRRLHTHTHYVFDVIVVCI